MSSAVCAFSSSRRSTRYENGASFEGRLTRCEPPRLLSHTWVEASGTYSEVTYGLARGGGQVLLVLTHRRLSPTMMVDAASGWHTHLAILRDRLSGQMPGPFCAAHEQAQSVYQQRIPGSPGNDLPRSNPIP